MEKKMSKCTYKVQKVKSEIDPSTGIPTDIPVTDKYGNHYYNIMFENKDYGSWGTKPDGSGYFEVGKEGEYTVEPAPDFNGKKQFRIKKPQKENTFGGGAKFTPKKKVAYKADQVSFGMAYAKDLLVAGKITEEQLGAMAIGITEMMWKQTDKLEGLE